MSHADSRDALAKALADRARARAAEQRELEASLRDGTPPSGVDAITAALDAQAARESTARPASAGRTALRWLAVAVVPMAAAAAVLLVLRSGPRALPLDTPSYEVAVTGHVQTERAGGPRVFTSLEAHADALEQVVLRPRERIGTKVDAKVVLVKGGAGTVADITTEVSDAGGVRFDVPGALLEGVSEVRVAIAPPALLDETVAAASSGATTQLGRAGATIVRVPVDHAR